MLRHSTYLKHKLRVAAGSFPLLPPRYWTVCSDLTCCPHVCPQASRTHLKQLMSDLETEQEKSTSIGNALAELKQQSEELVAAKEIAEGRMRAVQVQLSKANDSSAMMSDQLNEVRATLEVRSVC